MSQFLNDQEDELIQIAMEIIIESGEARKHLLSSMDSIGQFDFAKAKESIGVAREHIITAHKAQTDRMQAEIAQELPFKPSILFTHAQDTLMTVMSEITLVEKMIGVFEKFHQRFTE